MQGKGNSIASYIVNLALPTFAFKNEQQAQSTLFFTEKRAWIRLKGPQQSYYQGGSSDQDAGLKELCLLIFKLLLHSG